MSAPTRMCVGCRRRRPADELIRLTATSGRVEPVAAGAPGRGAYLCPSVECFDEAARRNAATRAFRRPVTMDDIARRRFTAACEGRKAVR